jgi:hypothetical protein
MPQAPTRLIEGTPQGLVRTAYTLRVGAQELGVLQLATLRERGTLHIGSDRYTLRREGLFGGHFLLEDPFGVVAEAEKPSAFRRAFVLHGKHGDSDLRRGSWWTRTFVVEQDGQQVGSIRPVGRIRQKVSAALPVAWPAREQAFAIWLVLLLWRRQNAGA